jgi:hypothetical protein
MRETRVTEIEAVERDGEMLLTFIAGRRRYPLRLNDTLTAGLESTLQGLRTAADHSGFEASGVKCSMLEKRLSQW